MTNLDQDTRARLRGLLGPSGYREGEALAALDPGIEPGNFIAGVAALPTSTAEVAAVVALCAKRKIPIVPLGGRTGLAKAGLSEPGQLVLLTSRMNRIIEIDPAAGVATVEPGVTLAALAAAAAPHGLTPGIDLAARDSCTIGGMIGTNAGGMEAFRHGPMRRRVLGLEVVMPNGEVFSDLKSIIKNNEGYDIKQLFIGAEGTLGVVTRAVLKLESDPGIRSAALCHMRDAAAAVALLHRLSRLPGGAQLTRAEILWRTHMNMTAEANGLRHLCAPETAGVSVIFEAASHQDGVAQEALESVLSDVLAGEESNTGLIDVLMPKNEKEVRDIWKVREDWAVDRAFPRGLWFDISVPLVRIDTYMRTLAHRLKSLDPILQLFCIAHLADGNLHVTVNAPRPIPEHADAVAALVYDGLREMGGSLSAEHGIGLSRRAALERYGDPVKLAAMRAVKKALDPDGLMNPGKVVD